MSLFAANEAIIELDLPRLEAISTTASSYPLPALRDTGERQTSPIPAILLANSAVQAWIVPSLGGRIFLGDGRCALEAIAAGRRGVELHGGLEVVLGPERRLNATGPVECQVSDDDTVRLFEAAPGEPCSWHADVFLDETALFVELRLYNRSWRTVSARPGLSLGPVVEIELAPHQLEVLTFKCSSDGDIRLVNVVESECADSLFESTTPMVFPAGTLGSKWEYALARIVNAVRCGDAERALSVVTDALALNAEDHWLWWLRHRLSAGASEDLMNAHFLAPLEPLLRAQGFLDQQVRVREPSPLVAPIAQSPDSLIDVACRLYELRLYGDLATWVDECSRHREIPMLRYLLASALLEATRMPAEAASHVRIAAKAPINAPYPWRPPELRALQHLASNFPQEARIGELLGMWREFALQS